MWKCFSDVVKRDNDELERNVMEVIESTQKENEAAKDRAIQTFKAEHEKMNEEEEEPMIMEELEKVLNESGEADGGTEVQQGTE